MPNNFTFVLEGVLAGMERPGTFGKLRNDLEFLYAHNIRAIVSLTETPLDRAYIEEFGFRYLHLPVADFTAPTMVQVRQFLEFQRAAEAEGRAVVVHCGAGLGRTGTMLACALASRGLAAAEAIDKMRTLRPFSIETIEQEDCVRRFAEALAKQNVQSNIGPPGDGDKKPGPPGPQAENDPGTKEHGGTGPAAQG
ncbi:MAG: dual specificity protein phosphatase family protein [Planctomycetota bacterium]